MGRNIINVIFGGARTKVPTAASSVQTEVQGEVRISTVDNVVETLSEANNIIIVPGYGLAVAQAQFAVADIAKKLKSMGKNIRFG